MNYAQKLRILVIANIVFKVLTLIVILFFVVAYIVSWEYENDVFYSAFIFIFIPTLILGLYLDVREREYAEKLKKDKKPDSQDSNSERAAEEQKNLPKRHKTKKDIFMTIVLYTILALVLLSFVSTAKGWSNHIDFLLRPIFIVYIFFSISFNLFDIIALGKSIRKGVDHKGSDGESDE